MINRLGQRIKENFQETTRDLNILSGSGGGSNNAYFDASEDKVFEVTKLLESRAETERLEGMKRIIAAMSKGRNMEVFFAQVVKNVVATSIEIRKLVYIYLLRYASTNSDLLLLSINTFQKDLSDQSPLIRSMSLRVLTSIRVPIIQGIVMLGLKKLVNDRNPYVRKTVAGGLVKVYDMDSTALSELIPLLRTLLASRSPLTLGPTLTAFSEMCPDRLDLLHPFYRHICRQLGDADEWGQLVALDVLTRYARTMLDRPETAGATASTTAGNGGKDGEKKDNNEEDEFEGIDVDLAMLLDHAKPLLQSRNPAVILAAAKMYFSLAPAGHSSIGQELLAAPLLRLAGSVSSDASTSSEIAALTWQVIAPMAEERPWLFRAHHTDFLLHAADPTPVKLSKLAGMVTLLSADNANASMREFKHYVNYADDPVAEQAVRALGHCVRTQPSVADAGLRTLMRLLKSPRSALVAQAVLVLKGVVLDGVVPAPQQLVGRLARQLDNIAHASARASVFWLVGQYAADNSPDTTMGLGWPGVAPWVPDVLRRGVRGFVAEDAPAKLQILTLASKLLVLVPSAGALTPLAQYLFTLARYDASYDVRDRARMLHALLRGVRDEKAIVGEGEDGEEETGGVTLRREQVKVVLLGKREAVATPVLQQTDLEVGTMSRVAHHKLGGYAALPDWTDDPTDVSLRESDLDDPVPVSALASMSISSAATASAVPRALSSANSPAASSPAGSLPHTTTARTAFRDLDDFLNSDESEEATESESEEEPYAVRTSAPAVGGRGFVSEYEEGDEDEDESEEDDDEEEEEEETDEEEGTDDEGEDEDERARLYR